RAALAESPQDVQRREHPGVREPEVAEVVVRAVLTAEHCLVLGHLRLDEGVPYPGPDCAAARPFYELRHRPGGDVVVDDGRLTPRLLLLEQLTQADQGRDRGRADRHPLLVDDEAPVRITVERQAEIGLL